MNNPPEVIQNHYAFPNGQGDEGMTLRDYFAAAAITGMWADPAPETPSYETLAKYAYMQADAMLKAREQ